MEPDGVYKFMKMGTLECGGQGRNRTAAANLFRDVRSRTYGQSSMKTQGLRDNDLDSIWTPGPFWTPDGLHRTGVGSVARLLLRARLYPPFQSCLINHETTFTCLYRKSPMDYHRSDVRT
jgi:hypothetical protein